MYRFAENVLSYAEICVDIYSHSVQYNWYAVVIRRTILKLYRFVCFFKIAELVFKMTIKSLTIRTPLLCGDGKM